MMKYWAKREAWIFMTPFGLPVVPPVYMMTQMSSASTAAGGLFRARLGEEVLIGEIAVEGWRCRRRRRRSSPPSARFFFMAFTWSTHSSCTINTFASQWLMMYSISGAESLNMMGTQMNPPFAAAA